MLDEALTHASEPEQYFFVMLDQDLETISLFYDGNNKTSPPPPICLRKSIF